MADNIKNLVISFILLGLFTMSFFSFLIYSTLENNPGSDLLKDENFNTTFNELNSSLESMQKTANEQKNLTFSENPLVATFGLVSTAVVGAGRVFSGMVFNTWNIIATFIGRTGIVPPIVISIIFTIIMIAIIFLIWKNWRQGE